MINAVFLSFTLLMQGTPPEPVEAANTPTESAQAVYLADKAAEERGDRSQLAVLGTAHLSGMPEAFDLDRFQPLLDRLKTWAPDRIAIEAIAGPQCDYMRTYAFAHGEAAEVYCYDVLPARAALSITGPEAAEEIETILSAPKAERAVAERRRLAGLFLASGEPWSALVQWLRLPEHKRTAEDGLTTELVEYLNGLVTNRNENSVIAAPLAAALGHERLFSVDDQASGSSTPDPDIYAKEITNIWDNEWVKTRLAQDESWTEKLVSEDTASVIDWYRLHLNDPAEARLIVASDFGAAAGASTPSDSGRSYLAYWETRNLRMAANIRQAMGKEGRMLAIVGASHKPYYERYLGVTSDLEIVDVRELLE